MKTSIRILTTLVLLCFFFKSVSYNSNTSTLSDPTVDSLLLDSSFVDSLLIYFNKLDKEKKRAIVSSLAKQSTATSQEQAIEIDKEQTNSSALWIFFYLTSMCLLLLIVKQYYQKKITTISNNPSRKHYTPPSSIASPSTPAITSTVPTKPPTSSISETSPIHKNVLIDQIKALREKNQTSQRQLTVNSLEFIRHENLVKAIEQKLSPVIERSKGDTRNQLIELSNLVERHQNHKNEWDSFRYFFGQVHPNFTVQLQEKFPNLNNNEIRLISFLRLQLTTTEIASLLKVTPSSIHKARYRLKKKLNLDKEVDLDNFLANFAKN